MLDAEFVLKRLWLDRDARAKKEWEALLASGGLGINEVVDYTIGIYHHDALIATGSLAQNILKCLIVCKKFQAENLLTELVGALTDRLEFDGITHYFLYTSPDKLNIFRSLGFSVIEEVSDVLFMERGQPNFPAYLTFLQTQKRVGTRNAAIVMNANPFTKGHRYLVEQACAHNDVVYVFVLSQDVSRFSTEDRMNMVKLGLADLPQVVVIPTQDYLVSQATFPSYFLKEDNPKQIAWHQARLDATLFKNKIAPALNITTRFVGEEPFSPVTELYNQTMQDVFAPKLQLKIIPRVKILDTTVSATLVRKELAAGNLAKIKELVPETTYQYILQHNL